MQRAHYLRRLWKELGGDDGAIIVADGEAIEKRASLMLPPIPNFGLEALTAFVGEAEAKVTELVRTKLKRSGVRAPEHFQCDMLVSFLQAKESKYL